MTKPSTYKILQNRWQEIRRPHQWEKCGPTEVASINHMLIAKKRNLVEEIKFYKDEKEDFFNKVIMKVELFSIYFRR